MFVSVVGGVNWRSDGVLFKALRGSLFRAMFCQLAPLGKATNHSSQSQKHSYPKQEWGVTADTR
jgi:hypothetical protein